MLRGRRFRSPCNRRRSFCYRKEYASIKKYLSVAHQNEIEKQGFAVIDEDKDLVTPLINNRQCAYSYHDEKGILKCAIEKAHKEDKISIQKPVSCHLFPIRITEYKNFDALNYEELDICRPARDCGKSLNVPVYKFLKEPLIRKYGTDWYKEVEIAADFVERSKHKSR